MKNLKEQIKEFQNELSLKKETKLQEIRREFDTLEQRFLKKLEEDEGLTRWRFDEGNYYWYLNDKGCAQSKPEKHQLQDRNRYDLGNYFKTKHEVFQHRDKMLLIQEIKDFAGDQRIDWSVEVLRHFIGFNTYNQQWDSFASSGCFIESPIFRTKEQAQECIDKFKDRLHLLL